VKVIGPNLRRSLRQVESCNHALIQLVRAAVDGEVVEFRFNV
jgi:hypothetical protein